MKEKHLSHFMEMSSYKVLILSITLLVSVCFAHTDLDRSLQCGDEEYDPEFEGCCGDIVFPLEEKKGTCRQGISVLLPTDHVSKDVGGIIRFQELPNNTLEIFILTKNLDININYILAATEYGDLSTYDGSGLGNILGAEQNDTELNNTIRYHNVKDLEGYVGEIEFVNDYTSATTYVVKGLQLRGDESILGRGVAIFIKSQDGTGEIVLQGTIGLCGDLCVQNYPIDEAIINYENWTWYQPNENGDDGNEDDNPNDGYDSENPNDGYDGENPNDGYDGENPNDGYDGENPNDGYDGENPNDGYDGDIPNDGSID